MTKLEGRKMHCHKFVLEQNGPDLDRQYHLLGIFTLKLRLPLPLKRGVGFNFQMTCGRGLCSCARNV
jgi:hypothetical protein